MKQEIKNSLVIISISIIGTLALVYLTPLKWINIIEPSIRDISPKEFYEQFKENADAYVFIDVRPEEAYERAHAIGSVNMPLHTLYDERHMLPKKGKDIVLICSGGRASGVAYSYLQHYGFFNIWRLEGGIEKWMAEGLPVAGTEIQSVGFGTIMKDALALNTYN